MNKDPTVQGFAHKNHVHTSNPHHSVYHLRPVSISHLSLFVMFPAQVRLSVTLEDLTLYVAQRADKEREAVTRQVSVPMDGAKAKLSEMEETLAGFQRTMHLVLAEVDADRERSDAIKVLF